MPYPNNNPPPKSGPKCEYPHCKTPYDDVKKCTCCPAFICKGHRYEGGECWLCD